MDQTLSAAEEGLWTVDDVAKFLQLRPYTIRAWARTRRLPAVVSGRVIRFVPQQIREWLKKCAR